MTLKEASEKYALKYAQSSQAETHMRIAFTAGAKFERERILGLLRSVPNIMAKDMYDSAADYIEAKLKERDV